MSEVLPSYELGTSLNKPIPANMVVHKIAALDEVTPPATESPSSEISPEDYRPDFDTQTAVGEDLAELFHENITAKVFRTAVRHLLSGDTPKKKLFQNTTPTPPECLPKRFPEDVPQHGETAGIFSLREPKFWTCGFFPGTLHAVMERTVKFPQAIHLQSDSRMSIGKLRSDIQALCSLWSEPLHDMANRKDTHDVGFIVMPALRKRWELLGETRSLESIIRAARSLASRYVPSANAIRSWDARIQKNIQITCQCQNVLLIIDSMCNLDLLYYAASHLPEGGSEMYDIATAHATTLLRTHLRPEVTATTSEDRYRGQWYSTHHVANVDPKTGEIKQQFTAQGYSDESTWARGQSWAILGYAQTYMWTKDKKFLHAACGLAEYFLYRMETSPNCVESTCHGAGDFTDVDDSASGVHRRRNHGGRFVPLWDFDSPIEDPSHPIRDSSAGAIAANGMLIISQALASLGDDRLTTRFRNAAMDVVRDLLDFALSSEKAQLQVGTGGEIDVEDVIPGQSFEALMKYGTVNNNIHAMRRYADHGIVYGDYYLTEFGNQLLRMGFE